MTDNLYPQKFWRVEGGQLAPHYRNIRYFHIACVQADQLDASIVEMSKDSWTDAGTPTGRTWTTEEARAMRRPGDDDEYWNDETLKARGIASAP